MKDGYVVFRSLWKSLLAEKGANAFCHINSPLVYFEHRMVNVSLQANGDLIGGNPCRSPEIKLKAEGGGIITQIPLEELERSSWSGQRRESSPMWLQPLSGCPFEEPALTSYQLSYSDVPSEDEKAILSGRALFVALHGVRALMMMDGSPWR